MLVYICFPVFTAHFYPPLHHNGKGSIVHLQQNAFMIQTGFCLMNVIIRDALSSLPYAGVSYRTFQWGWDRKLCV